MRMVEPIFISPIFIEYILPFVLIFTLVFAILEKTKVLGDGKKQINAIVAAISGLILLGFETFRDVITGIVPYAVVAMIVIFVFLLLYGFLGGKIYDILGHEVKTLVNKEQRPGQYEVTWDAAGQASGIYFYKLTAGDYSETKKMILLR